MTVFKIGQVVVRKTSALTKGSWPVEIADAPLIISRVSIDTCGNTRLRFVDGPNIGPDADWLATRFRLYSELNTLPEDRLLKFL